MRQRIGVGIVLLAVTGCTASQFLGGMILPDLAREGAATAVMIVSLVAAARHHGPARTAWILVTSGVALWILGDIVWDLYDILGITAPVVSAADACYLLGYPAIAAGLLVMLRRRTPSGNRDGLIDGLVLAAASTALAWNFMIMPNAGSGLPLLQRITGVSYPLGDIVLLAGLAWIAFSPGRRGRATYLLFASLGLTLVLDVLYYVVASGWISTVVGSSYPVAYALLAWAVLQPDAADLVEPAALEHPATHPARLVFLGLAVLASPIVAIIDSSRDRSAHGVLIGLSIFISALVVTRFALVVHAREAAEGTLAYQATHDQLTGLTNRSALVDRIDHTLSLRAWRDGVALLYLDLDRFQPVNDSWGHRTGDHVLSMIASRLGASVRPSDTVARIGGDEFVILCEALETPEAAVEVAERIVQAVEEPINVDDHIVVISASVGIAQPNADATSESLIRDADSAMYRAKELGRNRWEMFDANMRSRVERRRAAEVDLQQALRRGQFRVLYQPLVRVPNGDIVGFEALLRWERPGFGLVAPADFIPCAEETGLIIPIGTWVLEEACRQAVAWQRAFPDVKPSMSVNLSARQFEQPSLATTVAHALKNAGLDPRSLVLELTESLLIHSDERTLATLNEIKRQGVRIAIDDFGTGFSGLAYLRKFPFDILKVDQSFVEDLAPPDPDPTIVTSIVTLAHALGRTVVAEGVETPEQLAALRVMNCDVAQGYLIARPLTAHDAELMLRGARRPAIVGAPRDEAHIPAS